MDKKAINSGSNRSDSASAVLPTSLHQGTPLSIQMDRGNVFAEKCPSREILKHMTSRWAVLVFVALSKGTHRFSDLRRCIGGVSEKMLSQTLQALEADGFVDRIAYPVVPPHVEYSLTPLGSQAAEHVVAMADWIELHLGEILEAQTLFEQNNAR